MLKYKKYFGSAEFDPEQKTFYGEVVGLRTVIHFHGASVEELEQAFRDAVDDYLDWCKEDAKEPEKPFSGNLSLHLPQDLYKKLAIAAMTHHQSLNDYIVDELKRSLIL